jgi:short-subunit dehydrogenase
MDLEKNYGPAALIAGGSEGVGASYARLLAASGLDLVLIARNPEPLKSLRAEILARFPERDVLTLSLDLTAPDVLAKVCEGVGDREIGLLICNAGSCTTNRDFADNDLEFAQRLVALNATTPMALAHHYGRAMKARRRGGIILVGSMAALAGNPTIAAYSAAKAFSATFSEAIWHELAPFGVHVLHHQLGSTDTPFIARHFPQAVGRGEAPDAVALAGLEGLANGPLLRAAGGDDFAGYLATMSRADAVRAAHAAGQLFMQE